MTLPIARLALPYLFLLLFPLAALVTPAPVFAIAATDADREASRQAAETLTALLRALTGNPAIARPLSGLLKEAERGIREMVREVRGKDKEKGKEGRDGAKGTKATPEENDRFVVDLYRRILKREPDAGGRANWNGQLNAGRMSRAQVEKAFLASDEYKRRFGGGSPGGARPGGGTSGGGGTTAPPSGRGSLDDLLGGGTSSTGSGGAVTAAGGTREAKHVDFGPRDRGAIEFETSGITHQDKPCINGDWEYIFFTMNGQGMNRFLLLHAGGNGRAVRYVLQGGGTDTMRMEIASDNLPGWHRWRVEWGGGEFKVYLDGRQIGRTEKFAGAKPSSCIVGGNQNARRNFLGTWRNFKME